MKEFAEIIERVNMKITLYVIIQEIIKKTNTEERLDYSYKKTILRING